jgi:hypothetical protein
VREVDLGALLYASLVGRFLLGLFGLAYLASPVEERHHGRRFFILLLLVGVCGVGFDALHSFGKTSAFGPFLEILDDGVQTIVVSLVVAPVTSPLPPDRNPSRTSRWAGCDLGPPEA